MVAVVFQVLWTVKVHRGSEPHLTDTHVASAIPLEPKVQNPGTILRCVSVLELLASGEVIQMQVLL